MATSSPAGSNHGSAIRAASPASSIAPCSGWWAKASALTRSSSSVSAGVQARIATSVHRRAAARSSTAASPTGRARARSRTRAASRAAAGWSPCDHACAGPSLTRPARSEAAPAGRGVDDEVQAPRRGSVRSRDSVAAPRQPSSARAQRQPRGLVQGGGAVRPGRGVGDGLDPVEVAGSPLGPDVQADLGIDDDLLRGRHRRRRSASASTATLRLISASAIGPSSWWRAEVPTKPTTFSPSVTSRAARGQPVLRAVEVQQRQPARRTAERVHARHRLLAAVAALVEVHGRPDPAEPRWGSSGGRCPGRGAARRGRCAAPRRPTGPQRARPPRRTASRRSRGTKSYVAARSPVAGRQATAVPACHDG